MTATSAYARPLARNLFCHVSDGIRDRVLLLRTLSITNYLVSNFQSLGNLQIHF
ncbi:hypothetical protein M7I_2783 [Glarea lozoyensis 74030]|uniref:Uncharacterized protein n=1 Tax=Glarea lozoyensis (strain ATCC 74030 / MF5533) TaxID=1104152 RepID=H0EJQ3_GLAL7|nr:hypothetical protein M7I_2783 [Glarea lozoyensis 74030]